LQRNKATYPLAGTGVKEIKQRMLNWASQFSILLFLDSNNYPSSYAGYECLLAAGAAEIVRDDHPDPLFSLQQLHDRKQDWLFGHINYDFKNRLETRLVSAHAAKTGFPALHFFIPHTVCYIGRAQTELTIESFDDPALVYKAICACGTAQDSPQIPRLQFTKTTGKDRYLEVISKLRAHIADGDCYEINYCTEGFCENADVRPLQVFNALNALSPAPFAACYRLHDTYMMCASPERYLHKAGDRLMSQPIKGTARRDADPAKDEQIKNALGRDIKERAENVMIADLVRNDLARCCAVGSIQVDELFGIYSFPQVHQLISTVSGAMRPGIPFTDAIRYSFPMGSMTGAPKYKVMQLIEQYESSRRELFSGTVGYITPHGDFDFNVVIRSLFYNQAAKYLSYQTGGAITYDSVAEKEWDEMNLKAWALERIFS
jgi:para-aminobenzoate synthetase component I